MTVDVRDLVDSEKGLVSRWRAFLDQTVLLAKNLRILL
jgi:hypothetical protein